MRVEGASAGSGGRSVSSGQTRERDQRELHARLAARVQRGEVAVDVPRDLLGREHLAAPLDHHLGDRHEAQERDRVQIAETVAGAHRRAHHTANHAASARSIAIHPNSTTDADTCTPSTSCAGAPPQINVAIWPITSAT